MWIPEHEEPLGGPAVVGRGGIEVVLRTVGMVDEAVGALCGIEPRGPLPGPGEPTPVVVVAESTDAVGVPIGAAVGATDGGPVATLDAVVVDEDHRGSGVGAHLLAAWCSAASGTRSRRRGGPRPPEDPARVAFLVSATGSPRRVASWCARL